MPIAIANGADPTSGGGLDWHPIASLTDIPERRAITEGRTMNPYLRRVRLVPVLLLVTSLLPSAVVRAQEPSPAANPDIQQLLERMQKLEQRNAELEKTVTTLKEQANPAGTETLGGESGAVQLDPDAIHNIVTEFLEERAAEAGPQDPGAPAVGQDGKPVGNIRDDLGILSRGVYETSIRQRLFGAGRIAGFDQAFFLRTPDGSNYLRLGSDMEEDFRGFTNPNDAKDVDSFLIRRARINLDTIFDTYYDGRLMVDFAQKQNSTNTQATTIIQDAYLNVHYLDAFQFEAGKYKQPIGQEQLIQDRYTPFIERSLFDQLLPGRDVGVMAHGEMLFSDRFDWQVSLANGEFQNLDFDTNSSKDLTYRVLLRPFNNWGVLTFLSRLQFGMEGTVGVEHENLSKTAPGAAANASGFTLSTPATVPWLVFNNNAAAPAVKGAAVGDPVADGLRTRIAPSVSYYSGSAAFIAQLYEQRQKYQVSPTPLASGLLVNVPTTGFDILGTYILTGETRNGYSSPTIPLHPVDLADFFHGGYGAWEIGARVSRLDYGDEIFEGFNVGTAARPQRVQMANPAGNSQGATELTLGVNWYWNRQIKFQFNYEHSWFDQPVQLGPSRINLLNGDDAILTRFALLW